MANAALQAAAKAGFASVVKGLINAGVNPNADNGIALAIARRYGNRETIDFVARENDGARTRFELAANIQARKDEHKLAQVFSDYRLAVNVLKHGRSSSYDRLAKRSSELEFKMKLPDEAFFFEGDVSELVSVLIDVDDNFVERCAEIIQETLAVLRSKEEEARFL